MQITLTPPPIETKEQDAGMTELKGRIAQRDYAVDSDAVAEEILRKLRLVRWARRELVSGAGRTPERPAHGR